EESGLRRGAWRCDGPARATSKARLSASNLRRVAPAPCSGEARRKQHSGPAVRSKQEPGCNRAARTTAQARQRSRSAVEQASTRLNRNTDSPDRSELRRDAARSLTPA